MKKRVLSALLVLCMACSMVSTVWATETNATSGAPEPASQTLNLDNEQSGNENGADSTGAPSDSTDSTSASSDSTSSGSSSAASDATSGATSGAVSDVTSGEGDESAASSEVDGSEGTSTPSPTPTLQPESTEEPAVTPSPEPTSSVEPEPVVIAPNKAPVASVPNGMTDAPSNLAMEQYAWRELPDENLTVGSNLGKDNPLNGYRFKKTDVNFYVNLFSVIADSSQETGDTNASNFSYTVKQTAIAKYPAGDFACVKDGDNYIVIQGATNGSAYVVDQQIRALENSDNSTGFVIADVPTDEEVFNTIRANWDIWTKGKGIQINGKPITSDKLTTENYAIRWYVFKYNTGDAWHVDGILVPKYGRLTVTKTFTFPDDTNLTEENLRSIVPSGFTIQVESEGSSVENSYTLMMREQSPDEEAAYPGWVNEQVNVENKSITYTWEIDVLDSNYRITEQGANKANRELTATYMIGEGQETHLPDNGFVIDCDTAGEDTGSVAIQSVVLTNKYSAYNNPDEPETPDEKPDMPPLVNEKKAIRNNDGTYDLSLSVVGSTVTEEHPANVDVLMVVDTSGSMAQGTNRLANAKTAMTNMVNTLTTQPGVNARFSIVTFADNSALALDWTDGKSKNEIELAIESLWANGATDWKKGLAKAAEQMKDVRSEAQTIVIFLSDGEPTLCDGEGSGSDFIGEGYWDSIIIFPYWVEAVDPNLTKTYAEAKNIACDQFYAISLGIADDYEWCMTGLANAVNSTSHSEYIKASDPNGSDLTNIFGNISGSITNVACNNVNISDTLSKWAEVTLGENQQPEKLMVTVTDDQDQDVTEEEMAKGNIRAIYTKNEITGEETIQLAFGSDYQLKNNYTYTVTVKVQPTAAAYEDYAGKNCYPDTPDDGTGTHADAQENGYFSNAKASLTYTYVGFEDEKPEEVLFDDPVIRLSNGTVTINKAITGLSEEEEAELVKDMTFILTNVSEESKTYTANLNGVEPGPDGDYTVTIAEVEPGTYKVTEQNATVEGYDVSTTGLTDSLKVAIGGSNTVAITNAYTRDNNDLKITKEVNGEGVPVADTDVADEQFTFEITAPSTIDTSKLAGPFTVENATSGSLSFNAAGKATVTMTGAETVTIKGLPNGEYTVTETGSPADLKTAYYAGNNGAQSATVSADTAGEVTIINTYKPYLTLAITKSVTGEMGSSEDYFDFTLTGVDSDQYELEQDQESEDANFKLNNGSTVTLTGLKPGDIVTISETTANGYTAKGITIAEGSALTEEAFSNQTTTSVTITIPEGNAANLGTVIFTNHREAVAPTGLESNHTTPYVLMITAAGMAGLALIGGMAARRVRRRRED